MHRNSGLELDPSGEIAAGLQHQGPNLRYDARKTDSQREPINTKTKKKQANEKTSPSEEVDLFCRIRNAFGFFARRASSALGTPWAFVAALVTIVVWAVTGPTFHYSDTWQLIINTGTTIVTFLMVFLIQNTQNRDSKAVHLKLDELIRALEPARDKLVDLEKLSDDELANLEREFEKVRTKAEGARKKVEKLKKAVSS